MTYEALKARLERTERTLQGIEDFRVATGDETLFETAEQALVGRELKDLEAATLLQEAEEMMGREEME